MQNQEVRGSCLCLRVAVISHAVGPGVRVSGER